MKFILSQPLFIHELGKRTNQEDNIFPADGTATVNDRLFLVCDGMGGHGHGELASQTVCDVFSKYILENIGEDTVFTDELFKEALQQAYLELDANDPNDSYKKMGTTLTFLFFHKGGCMMAHIGDSRIYHIRPSEKKVKYISRDHSVVFDLFRCGEITFEEMQTHPKKNIITRSMMPGEDYRFQADIAHTTDVLPGDYFYLCSDGMLEQMQEMDILGIFCSDSSDEAKRQRLISATMDNSDNHSAYIIRVDGVEMEEGDEELPNDEENAYGNMVNYIPELNDKEATRVAAGDFKADDPDKIKRKKKFPWVKVVTALIIISFVGLFVVTKYMSDHAETRIDERTGLTEDTIKTEDETPEKAELKKPDPTTTNQTQTQTQTQEKKKDETKKKEEEKPDEKKDGIEGVKNDKETTATVEKTDQTTIKAETTSQTKTQETPSNESVKKEDNTFNPASITPGQTTTPTEQKPNEVKDNKQNP